MRKVFSKMAVVLATSSLVLPLTACVFNFYVNSATNTVLKSFADQTSSVLKSLVMSKENNTDTSQTIQDILNEFPNSSIKNQTQDTSLNTWDEFVEHWGYDKKINISGFNPENSKEGYFVATGKGTITQQVNTYKSTNNILNQANLISGLNVANNQIVYNLIKEGDIKNTIIGFLNETKVTDPNQASTIIKLLKNTVVGAGKDSWQNPKPNAFMDTVVNPLTSLLNYLVKGLWTPTQSTPSDTSALNSFMTNWTDSDGQSYSQWNDGSSWTLKNDYYSDWNTNDFNFYRSGVLINHLFYQISKDYQLAKPNPDSKPKLDPINPRYLGEIISENVDLSDPDSIEENLMKDLEQYLPHLLDNPAYILTIVEAVVPIIKEWALKMSDITQGAKNLTFGKIYPTDDSNNSYNATDILKNIYEIIDYSNDDPNNSILKGLLENLLGLNGHVTGGSFTYDLKINVVVNEPLPILYDLPIVGPIVREAVENLIQTVLKLIKDIDLKGIFNNILNVYEKWIQQYDDASQGINFDLTKLYDFLLNDTNGLIKIINDEIIPVLYEIMNNPDPITENDDSDYFSFYQSLGGQLPNTPDESPPFNFKANSTLDILQSNIGNTNTSLGQLILILLGNSSENGNDGLFSFIIESNNQWIKDNYIKFFDVTNKSDGQIYDAAIATNVENNIVYTTITYNFTFKIKGKTYSFWVRCKSSDKKDDFTGTKNFYFTDIKLKSIK